MERELLFWGDFLSFRGEIIALRGFGGFKWTVEIAGGGL
jgi:hypothetical protein